MTSTERRKPRVGKGESSKILIVDDVPGNIKILADILQSDHEILAAATGLDALEVAVQQQPDLILLDVVIPGIDGHETCRRL